MKKSRNIVLATLALVACGKAEDPAHREVPAQQPDRAGTDVAVTTTPGVALSYDYRYRLPVRRIVEVQERHAAACEALGPAQCRIVGMHYVTDNGRIAASLALRLAPAIARRFGKAATAVVVAGDGMLVEETIDSVEAGRTAAAAETEERSLTDEQQALQGQLASGQGGGQERSQVQARVAALRDAARATQQNAASARALLAETPVAIRYESGVIDASFGDGPVLRALKQGWGNVVEGIANLVLLVVTLLPWALALIAAIILWARLKRPFRRLLGLDTAE